MNTQPNTTDAAAGKTDGQILATLLRQVFKVGTRTKRYRKGADLHVDMIEAIENAVQLPGYFSAEKTAVFRAAWGAVMSYSKHVRGYRIDGMLAKRINDLSAYQFAALLGRMVDAGVSTTGDGERFFGDMTRALRAAEAAPAPSATQPVANTETEIHVTRTAELLDTRTTDDHGNDIARFTGFRAVVPLSENRRYVSSGGEVTVRIEARDADIDDADQVSYLWEGPAPHRHVLDDAERIHETAMDELARQGFKVDEQGWVLDGESWVAGIEKQPEIQRCKCGRLAHRMFTLLDPVTSEPDESTTFYRCSLHAYDADVPQENVRQWQICWRGVEFGSEPYCLEPIEFDLDERGFGGWRHVNRRISNAHHHAVHRI